MKKLLSENHGQGCPAGSVSAESIYLSQRGADTKSWAGKRWGGWETWADLHVDGKSIQAKNRWPTGNIHYGRRKINNAFRRDELVCLIRIRLSTDSTTDWYSFFPLFVSTLMEEQSRTLRLNTAGMIGVGKKKRKKRNTSSVHETCARSPWEVTEILIFFWGYIYHWSFEKDIKVVERKENGERLDCSTYTL